MHYTYGDALGAVAMNFPNVTQSVQAVAKPTMASVQAVAKPTAQGTHPTMMDPRAWAFEIETTARDLANAIRAFAISHGRDMAAGARAEHRVARLEYLIMRARPSLSL